MLNFLLCDEIFLGVYDEILTRIFAQMMCLWLEVIRKKKEI